MEEYHQKLVDSFEQIISQNAVNKLEQVNSKSILELDKGIIQFNVEDRGLGQRFRVNLQQNSNKKIIFNNSHYNPIHSDAFSNSVQTVRIELKQDIQKEINQLDYNQLIDTFDHKNLSKELENQFVSISVDEFNISSKNPFSLGFQFNELTNEFKDFNYEMIDGIFKNFSTEGYTGEIIQISDKVSKNQDDHLNYKIKKYTNYSSKEQIEQDFLDLSKNFNEYCEQKEKYSPSKQQYRSIRSNKDYYQDLKMIQIIGEEKVKIFNRIYDQLNTSKVENEDLFDFDSAQKYIKSSYESDVKKKNLKNLQYKGKEVNEIIEQARMRVQNDQFVYDNQNDEISNPQMFFKEAKLNEVGQVQSQIKQWAIEDDQDVSTFQDKLPKEKMAINYPFELDNFQKRSILRLEQGQNVFVCAPTSAGKTLVAEYSIALSKKHKRRVIYVSPIKSLSNQKYRDFKEKFGDDVGIITGDISLNPSASCLIVTTEVLRNMLYKANHIVREFAWVIFDEVHNINNQYRGVVWEEAIILLPENIGLVMLSATVPNYMEFADWVGRTKQRKIYVQKTLNRPVPLEHSIYYDGKIFVIKQANEGFNQENYEKINKYLKDQQNKQKAVVSEKDKLKQEKKDKEIYKNTNLSQNAKEKQKLIQEKFIKKTSMTNGSLTEAQQIKNLLKYCQENELLPCIVFTFSKNTIKELSESLGNLNLINHEESKQIEEFFNKASHKLKTTDLEVSQIRTLKDLIMRGIAVHHSDVIPFIKEVVEILFSKGLIKVLFATETFAMGINMPTKTVIFYALKKFDSSQLRILNSTEYAQMSGRAGRRGLDQKGNVIILVTEPKRLPSKMELTKMLDHKLLSSREIDVTEMMNKSYGQNYKYSQLSLNLKRTQEIQKELKDIQQIVCPLIPLTIPTVPTVPIKDFYQIAQQMQQANKAYWSTETKYLQNDFVIPSYCQFIDQDYNDYLGLIVEFIRKESYENYFVVMFAYQMTDNIVQPNFQKLGRSCYFNDGLYNAYNIQVQRKEYIYELIELPAKMISKIFDVGFDAKFKGLKNQNYLKNCANNLIYKMNTTYLDYRLMRNGKDLKNIKNKKQFLDEYKQVGTESNPNDKENYESIQEGFDRSLCYTCNKKNEHFKLVSQRNELQNEFDNLIKALDEDDFAEPINFQQSLNILKQLNYIDEENLPQLKAKLAKEIDNLYVSELIVQGIFNELNEAEIAAILIGFVTQSNKKEGEQDYDPFEDCKVHGFQYSEKFLEAYDKTLKIINQTVQLEIDNEIIIVSEIKDAIAQIFNPQLIKVAYEWVQGKDFLQVTKLQDGQEGAIIRSMLRLNNLMKNIKNSAQYIGNNSLSLKIESCQEKMRRDIIFAQSLYLEEDNKLICLKNI